MSAHVDPSGVVDSEAKEPALQGNRCAQCGTGYFPRLRFGCEVCGADQHSLLDEIFDTEGHLWARARVVEPGGGWFVIAEVALAAGPKIRVLLDGDVGAIGDSVRAVWHGLEGATSTREPRWVPQGDPR